MSVHNIYNNYMEPRGEKLPNSNTQIIINLQIVNHVISKKKT